MREWRRWREAVADWARLREWRRDAAIDPAADAVARKLLGHGPDVVQWRWFLDRLALSLGVALCAAGLICFIAANWEHIGKFTRLYGIQTLLVAAVAVAARLGVARTGGQAALWLAMVLLGGLFALIGQTYQTGADTWELFSLWAVLALPWAFAGRHVAIWLLWIAVANIALGLWADIFSHPLRSSERSLSFVGLFDLALFLGWSFAMKRWTDFEGRVGPRVLVAAALLCASLPAIGAALEGVEPRVGFELCAWLIVAAAMAVFALRVDRDRAVLAMIAVSAIGVSTVWLFRLASVHLFARNDEPAALWLLLAVLVVTEAAAAALWLRRLDRRPEQAKT